MDSLRMMSKNDMLEKVINSVPLFIFWKDTNLVFMGCNKNFANMVGLSSPDDIVGKTDYDISKRKNADYFVDLDKEIMRRGEGIFEKVQRYENKDGKTIWISINKIPLTNENGDVIGILGSFQDITENIDTSMKLKQSEEKYRSLIDFTGTSYIIMNMDFEIIEANQNFVSLLKKESLERILGKNPRSWVHVTDIDKFDSYFNELIAKQNVSEIEFSFVTKNDQQIYVTMASNIVENGEKKIFCLMRDASLRKMNKDIEYIGKQKRKDKLAQVIRQIRNNIKSTISK